RGADGKARASDNACRHRATRLVDAPCSQKAMVCAYHGWTYDLDGRLMHAPHAESFSCSLAARNLIEVPVVEIHGLIFTGEGALGEVGADLAALDLDNHVVFKTSEVTRRCNWKLIVEAFLDSYHIRILHRDSVYRFFIDAASVAESVGPHIRAVTARRAMRFYQGASRPTAGGPSGASLRALTTPSAVIFPTTITVAHPDFVSILAFEPRTPNTTIYRHVMLVPKSRADDRDHWMKSWGLIEGSVFQREDLWVCEQMQRGIEAG